MTFRPLIMTAAAGLVLAACSGAEQSPQASQEVVKTTAAKAVTQAAKPDTSYTEAPSGTYALDKNHASIVFSYAHLGYSKPFIRWKDWSSSLEWNAEDPAASSVTVDIETAKVDSGVDVFDEHLRAERWFDASGYPDISFKSTSLTKTSESTGTMTGDLTVKGVTKPVALDVTFNKAALDGRSKSHKIGFSARGQLNRSEWGLGGGVPAIADNIDLMIEAEYAMKAE